MATDKQYDASSIRAIDERTHLLKRLSLTFGAENSNSEFSSQKGVALRELLDNALDEIRAGYGENVRLAFFEDRSFEVQDSGRGIPVDTGIDGNGKPVSGIFLSLGVVRSGGKFETDSKRFSSGLNGIGASSSCMISKRLDVTIYRNKKKYELSFKDGTAGFFAEADNPDSDFTPIKDLTYVKESKDTRSASEKKMFPTGTTIKVWLRDEVFSSSNPYDAEDIINRVRGTAFLVPKLHVDVYNELNKIENPKTGQLEPQVEEYQFPDGVEELIELNQSSQKLHETIHIVTEGTYMEKNVPVLQSNGTVTNQNIERKTLIEVAFRYGNQYDSHVESYVNTIHTKLHGAHVTAFERAMLNSFGEKFKSMRGLIPKNDEPPIAEDFMEGITAVVSVQISEPQFTSQSKEALSGREVQKAIQEALIQDFNKWINVGANKDVLATIAKKVTTASKNRQRAKEQKEINRKVNEISSASLPVKLVDCELAGTDDAELYICEGDSAVSSLKAARDGKNNALLGIRGKIINAHKENAKRVLGNAEVQDIIKTLGAGSGKDFDLDKARYGRIFIAVDADPDGNAIATLIYALFWHQFRAIIEDNRLYKIETPLFVISTNQGKKSEKMYARDDRELNAIKKKLDKKNVKYSTTRLKGLGEVMADTLEETAISPATRIVTQITLDDAVAAAESLDLILGPDTAPRKEWIEQSEVDEALIGE